jgi:hypothetical protein
MDNNTMTSAPAGADITPAMIEGWKKKYGDVFIVEADGKRAYLRRPDRQTIAAAAVIGGADGFKQKEIVIRNCWLGGDRELVEADKYFLSLAAQVDSIVEIVEVSLKKA